MSVFIENLVPHVVVILPIRVLRRQLRVAFAGEVERNADGNTRQRGVVRIKRVGTFIQKLEGGRNVTRFIECLGRDRIGANHADDRKQRQ